MSRVRGWVALALAALFSFAAAASQAPAKAADPGLDARVLRIAAELRCLVCQNQTIADSDAALAVDLRRETRALLEQGKSDREVVDYMTARYGDFVLYRPPLKATTALLWFGPAILLLGGAAVLILVLRRRSRLGAEAFEPDLDDDDRPAAPTRTTGPR
ncbi:MAG TPA: cytochrome c-type biogenesis protein [Caldimonas sp.]|jgi:cytochrome c-type biogenesis protein CcmH|nr:cytochrome c-type biogenesis protein [Caldimonas sp.]HEX2540617.1 cytochrome c-type biogenesis protein [Caldimonas sp.]